MSLEYIFINLPDHHRMSIKAAMATEAVQILFNDAMVECENELKFMNESLAPEEFKLRYLELKKSVQAYIEINDIIHKLKQGDLK